LLFSSPNISGEEKTVHARIFFCIILLVAGITAGAQAANYVKLMGMIEFKRPLSSLPIWIATMQRNMKQPIFKPGYMFNGKEKISWDTFRDRASHKQGKDLLRFVHQYWNTKPYRSDRSVWGVDDYWEAPYEFIKNSGDCEDYAITKYFTLKALGFPISQMRIGVMKDPVRDIAHATLIVYMDGTAYFMDNLSNAIVEHTFLHSYTLHFSVNEENRWAHIPVRPKL
jgi:predicted transglutaminase-like cysteine proteinase